MKTARKSPPLVVIGMQASGMDSLTMPATRALFEAEVIFTSRRIAGLLPEAVQAQVRTWPSPFRVLGEEIANLRQQGKRVAVVLTGSPFWYGAGPLLTRWVPPEEMEVHPAPSAFSLAAARMGWPLQHVRTLTLHGRRGACLERHILPGARLLIIGENSATPLKAARRLVRRGFSQSRMTILSWMGTRKESRETLTAAEIAEDNRADFPGFHVLAVEVKADAQAQILPLAPGLPDEAFVHDGQITKRSLRAVTVSMLAPRPHAVLWDVGAGCGSVAVEWIRIAGPEARGYAVERNETRCRMIEENIDRLGGVGLTVVHGEAPEALADLPAPDAVFIGGGVSREDILDFTLAALNPGGVLIANAVTMEGETQLMNRHARHGGDLVRLSENRAEALGRMRTFRPALAITQWRYVKDRAA